MKNGTGWIYAIQDSGYERGIKIGMDSSSNGMACWQHVPCYSPRPMLYRAAWRVNLPFTDRNGRIHATPKTVERHVHSNLRAHWLDHGCNGEEWFNLTADEAIDLITGILSLRPQELDRHEGRVVCNDQFRNPHPRHLPTHNKKVIAWIYQEQFTKRVKTQIIDDWATPRKTRRRYSRNGFSALAAFTYDGKSVPHDNRVVFAAWEQTMRHFGPSADDGVYGWLSEGAAPDFVADLYRLSGLEAIDIRVSTPPEGVKRAYNRSD